MRRIFFDANVIIAGSMSRTGASHALLILAEAGLFQIVVSRLVLDEVDRILRLKFPQALPLMAELLGHIRLEVLDDPEPEDFTQWLDIIEPGDAPILQSALKAQVDYLITLNTEDFKPDVTRATGLRFMEPLELIERMREIVSVGFD